MDYEKKYKEALEIAKRCYKDLNNLDGVVATMSKDFFEEVFPELKESEDERMRKHIIEVLKDNFSGEDADRCIAWLEKQGEQNPVGGNERETEINLVEILKHYPRETELYSPLYGKLWLAEVDEKNEIITCYKHCLDEGCTRAILEQEDTVSFYSNGTTGLPDFNVSEDCMLFLYDIEKQDEQKPVDKVEPKFRVGDWIIKNDDSSINVDYSCCEITNVENGNYTIESTYGYKGYNTFETFEKDYHLWTIQDAKDGDVLYSDNDIIVTKAIYNANNPHFISYCSYSIEYNIFQSWERDCWFAEAFVPTTKEQRDLLFQKMHEAGYEWDEKKKELKKFEKKQDWSEEDEVGLDNAMWKIEQAMGNLWHVERWLESLKERMKGE